MHIFTFKYFVFLKIGFVRIISIDRELGQILTDTCTQRFRHLVVSDRARDKRLRDEKAFYIGKLSTGGT